MPRSFDQRKWMNRLVHDENMELMPYELNEILEKELSKPAEEVDAQLVKDILELLGEEEPTAAEKEASWQKIQKKRKAQKRCCWKTAMRRAAAAAAVLVVLFFVSFESAKAFRWSFLLKLLAPVAETFGICSTSAFETDDPVNNPAVVIDDDTEYEQVVYSSLDEMPAEVNGYRTVPAWVPERFTFMQGTFYEDPDMAHCSLYYHNMDDSLIIDTYIYYNEEAVFAYEFERTLPEPRNEEINGFSVSIYHNADGNSLSASRIEESTHYHVYGNVTEEELKQIIGSFAE